MVHSTTINVIHVVHSTIVHSEIGHVIDVVHPATINLAHVVHPVSLIFRIGDIVIDSVSGAPVAAMQPCRTLAVLAHYNGSHD
jgi:hypothetical protein